MWIFVSYSREDKASKDALLRMLEPALESRGIDVWDDSYVKSGESWNESITAAIETIDFDFAILLVSGSYLTSNYIWQTEVPLLVERGVKIIWVLLSDCLWGEKQLLRETQCVQDLAIDGPLDEADNTPRMLTTILRRILDEHVGDYDRSGPQANAAMLDGPSQPTVQGELLRPSERSGSVHGVVPALPDYYVPRTSTTEAIRDDLQVGRRPATGSKKAATVGVFGGGGAGKTLLAADLAVNHNLGRLFPDGIFWVSLGEDPDLVDGQQTILRAFRVGAEIRSPLEGIRELRSELAQRRCLIVVDDVRSVAAAEAFHVTGPSGRVLYTTRDPLILRKLGSVAHELDALSPDEARELLGEFINDLPSPGDPWVETLLASTGRLPLAVALTGAAIGRGGQTWERALAMLEGSPLDALGHPDANTFKAMALAIDALPASSRERYQMLACFPEQTIVPVDTIARLWGADIEATGEVLGQLERLRLLRLDDGVSFHQAQRAYLLLHARAVSLAHDALLASHRPANGWTTLNDDEPYLWDRLTYHLGEAGQFDELLAIATDPAWIARRIGRDGPRGCEEDLTIARYWEPADREIEAWERRLQQRTHLLLRAEPDHIASTLELHCFGLPGRLGQGGFGGGGVRPMWIADRTSPSLLRSLVGHNDGVREVAWSPLGDRLASLSRDRTVIVWDAATGDELHRFSRLNREVTAVAWSPDGSLLAIAFSDRNSTLGLWDADTGELLSELTGHRYSVRSIDWSPDGRRVATGSSDRTVHVWDARIGVRLHLLTGHGSSVTSVAWSPDGRLLATAGGRVRIWDPEAGHQLGLLEGPGFGTTSVAWSPDGRLLASASHDAVVRLWDPRTTEELRSAPGGNRTLVATLAWSPDGRFLATGSEAAELVIWDALSDWSVTPLGDESVGATALDWSADCRTLATSNPADDVVRIWRCVEPGEIELTRKLSGHIDWVEGVAWAPDGRRLASASLDWTIRTWDVFTDDDTMEPAGHERALTAVAWSPDGRRLVSAGEDRAIRVWAPDGEELRSIGGLTDAPISLSWSPEGNAVLAGGREVGAWDAGSGSFLVGSRQEWPRLAAWSGPGVGLLAVSGRSSVRVFTSETFERQRKLPGHDYGVTSIAWAPSGSRLATAARNGIVQIWDGVTGERRQAIEGHGYGVTVLAWEPDGRRLISAGNDGAIYLWDSDDGRLLREIDGPGPAISAVAWSPDAPSFVVGTIDGVVAIIDAESGRVTEKIVAANRVAAVSWTPAPKIAVATERPLIVLDVS